MLLSYLLVKKRLRFNNIFLNNTEVGAFESLVTFIFRKWEWLWEKCHKLPQKATW